MFFIHQYCQNEAYDTNRRSFGYSWEYPYHYIPCTIYCEHGGKNTDGGDVVKCKVCVNKFSWLKDTSGNCCSLVGSWKKFCVADFAWYFVYFLGQCFGSPYRVWWHHIDLMTISESWMRRQWMISHDMGCFLKELLMVRFMGRVMMYWPESFCCSSLSISMVMKSNNCWSLSLSDASTLNFIPVSVVIFTHLGAPVLTFLNSL